MTYLRAFRVLWGFLWRSCVVTLPLLFVGPWLYVAVLPAEFINNPDLWLDPGSLLVYGSRLMLVSLLLTVISVALMVVAMRWTLNAVWADFRLRAVPRSEQG